MFNRLTLNRPAIVYPELSEASLDELDLLVRPACDCVRDVMRLDYYSTPSEDLIKLGPLRDMDGSRNFRHHSYTGFVMVIDPFNDSAETLQRKLSISQLILTRDDIIGIDFEFGGDPRDETDKFIALVQIAVSDFVLLLRTPRVSDFRNPWKSSGGLPIWVREILMNPLKIKAAVGFNGEDSKYLHLSFGICINWDEGGIFELQEEIKRVVPFPLKKSGAPSFETLCRHFGYFPLKHGEASPEDESRAERQKRRAEELAKASLLVKVQTVWGSDRPLPPHKVRYAAEDAWFNCLVYTRLQSSHAVELASLHAHLALPVPARPAELIPHRSQAEVEASAIARDAFIQAKEMKICSFLISAFPVEGVSVERQSGGYDLKVCLFTFCLQEDSAVCVVHSLPRAWLGKVHEPTLQAEAHQDLWKFLRVELCSIWLFESSVENLSRQSLPILCRRSDV